MSSRCYRALFVPLLAVTAVSGGCLYSFYHYEPGLESTTVADYSKECSGVSPPSDRNVLVAVPLGVRCVGGGLNVDVLFCGARASEVFSPGKMDDVEPLAPFWVSVSKEQGERHIAGLPRRVVDSNTLGPPLANVDRSLTPIMETSAVPGDACRVVVTIPVIAAQQFKRGDPSFVTVLFHDGEGRPAILITKWNHESVSYTSGCERRLVVR